MRKIRTGAEVSVPIWIDLTCRDGGCRWGRSRWIRLEPATHFGLGEGDDDDGLHGAEAPDEEEGIVCQ